MKKLLLSICFLLTYLLLVCSFAHAGENQDCLYWTDPVLGPQMHGVGCRELPKFKVLAPAILFSASDSTPPVIMIVQCKESGRQCKVLDSSAFPCYKKLQDAVRIINEKLRPRVLGREKLWTPDLEATYQECVK